MFYLDLPPRIRESLKTLVCLAHASGPLKAREIASRAQIPPAQTAKILQSLAWAGFVDSRRGMKGGFWLAHPPDRMRASEVMTFFGPRGRAASQREKDPLVAFLTRALARCPKAFDEITIADLASIAACKPSGSIQSRGRSRHVPGSYGYILGTKKSPRTVRGKS